MLEVPQAVTRLSALVLALGAIFATTFIGWDVAVQLAQLVRRFHDADAEHEHRIDSLEGEACDAWLQGESELIRGGLTEGVIRRPQPRFCIESRP